jgi:hypothetical protein
MSPVPLHGDESGSLGDLAKDSPPRPSLFRESTAYSVPELILIQLKLNG